MAKLSMARRVSVFYHKSCVGLGKRAARKVSSIFELGDAVTGKHNNGVESDPVTNGAKGGRARAEKMTAVERREVAQKAADARWGKTVMHAEYVGTLPVSEMNLDCVVLADGRRVISQGSILASLGRSETSGRRTRNDNRPPFVEAGNLVPFFTDDLKSKFERVEYRLDGVIGTRLGYEAEILPLVCEVYLAAREAGVLTPQQAPAAQQAEILVRGLSRVGIIALVDEATGYQAKRAKDELAQLLDAYVSEEFRRWVKRFPETFFEELYKLHGWQFRPGNHKHPMYVGKFINNYVYEAMPPGVLEGLQEANPTGVSGRRPRKLHQHLTEEVGTGHLEEQIKQTVTLMKLATSKDEFHALFRRLHPENPMQDALPLEL